MSTVSGGVIHALSVSQVESFDPSQTGGCQRRWYFERVEGRRPESSNAQTDGDLGHALLATYLRGGELPKRAKMLKHVRGAIAAGNLPTPGPDLLVEQRFDDQPARDASGTRVQLDAARTLLLGGVPWDGYVDLQFRRWKSVVEVVDHKFSSDIDTYAKPSDGLIRTVQMPVYARNALRRWPDAREFRLTHHYVSRRGVASFLRSQVVTLDQVLERVADVERVVAEMQDVARATRQDDVPFNRRACAAYAGCPHQSRCTAFRRNQMNLTAEELELFGPPSDAPKPPVVEEDPFATDDTRAWSPDALKAAASGDVAKAEEIQRAADAERSDPAPASEPLDIPLPEASKPAAQPSIACECGATLTPENSSRLQDSTHKHIGCPLAATNTDQPAPKRRGRPPKVKPETTGGETCKQCGEQGATTLAASGLQVHNGCKGAPLRTDGAESGRLHSGEPNTANGPRGEPPSVTGGAAEADWEAIQAEAVKHAQEKFGPGGPEDLTKPDPETLRPARLSARATVPVHPLAGTLRVEVDISDRLASFLERLVGAPR